MSAPWWLVQSRATVLQSSQGIQRSLVTPPCRINRMLEDQTLDILSCLVVDELHMVGDEDRGYQ